MFDEFRAPVRPNPGMHEFAIVATRARTIRRQRRAWAASAALAVTGLLAVTALVIERPRDVSISTDDVPTTQGDTTVREYSLDQLAAIDQLPTLNTRGRTLAFMAEGQRGEIAALPDGAVCVRRVDGIEPPSCAAVDAGLHVTFWADAAMPGRPPLAIFLVAEEVSVAVKAAGNACTVALVDGPIEVWACMELDPTTTSVRVIAADRVLIDTISRAGS